MGTKTETGFTIIETMLFLAVTGLLAMGILVGSGVAIGQQRYRDSVNSLKSYIQQQYSEVTNVVNDRAKTWTCDANGNVTTGDAVSSEARGTSDCMLLGRFITIDATGKALSTANVVGVRGAGAEAASDIAEITTNYKMSASPVDTTTAEVSWGAQVVKQKTTTPMPLSILILRSPLSGSVLTFTAEGVQTNLGAMVTAANMSVKRDICVNADLGSFVGKRMEVQIGAYASSQTAIQIPSEGDSVCD
jgi:type II secretory pathway pseudopilin PulG